MHTCNEKDLLPFICAQNELDESYTQRDSLPSERKTNRYFISKTTSTDHARRTSVRFINIVIGAQKFVCHTQKSYVFLLRQQTTPPTEGNLSLPLLPSLASSPTPCSTTTTTTLPLFFYRTSQFSFSFSLGLSDPLSRFAVPFLFSPHSRRIIPPYSGLLFRSFSRRGNRLSLRRTCSHSSRTIERKRGRKRYFSRTARTSASAVNSGRPDRSENFAKYRS